MPHPPLSDIMDAIGAHIVIGNAEHWGNEEMNAMKSWSEIRKATAFSKRWKDVDRVAHLFRICANTINRAAS